MERTVVRRRPSIIGGPLVPTVPLGAAAVALGLRVRAVARCSASAVGSGQRTADAPPLDWYFEAK